MRRYTSYIASDIDREYKNKKIFAKKQRANCKDKECYKCEYTRICSVSNDGIEKEEM